MCESVFAVCMCATYVSKQLRELKHAITKADIKKMEMTILYKLITDLFVNIKKMFDSKRISCTS